MKICLFRKNFFSSRKTLIFFITGISALLVGCTQLQQGEKINHPGKYELIKYGYKQIGNERFRITKVHDRIFYSYQRILGPTFFSLYLLEHTHINPGESVLDVGAGSGIQAIFAADKASHVLATDIDQLALKNTLLNARRFNIEHKIAVRKSDLFNALKPDEVFDVIIASIPYAWDEKTQHFWGLQERFFVDVGKHLKPDGRIYFLTGWLENLQRTRDFIKKNNLRIVSLKMDYAHGHKLEPIVYVIKHASPQEQDEN